MRRLTEKPTSIDRSLYFVVELDTIIPILLPSRAIHRRIRGISINIMRFGWMPPFARKYL